MKFYIDLDRTAFRTDQTDEIWRVCGELFPEFDESIAKKYADFIVTMPGDTYYYDLTPHLESVGLDPEKVYAKLHDSSLADGHLQHDGLEELVGAMRASGSLQVLTFGPDRYQRFKASLCPALEGVEVVTTLEDKAEFFRSAGEDSLLIDDKPVGFRLPPDMHFVQVSLEGKQVDTLADWPVYTSLTQVKEYIDETMH